jgi:hypothetical protein
MVKTMTKHVMENNPDTAKQMEKMHAEDPKTWGGEMKPKWEAIPETGSSGFGLLAASREK